MRFNHFLVFFFCFLILSSRQRDACQQKIIKLEVTDENTTAASLATIFYRSESFWRLIWEANRRDFTIPERREPSSQKIFPIGSSVIIPPLTDCIYLMPKNCLLQLNILHDEYMELEEQEKIELRNQQLAESNCPFIFTPRVNETTFELYNPEETQENGRKLFDPSGTLFLLGAMGALTTYAIGAWNLYATTMAIRQVYSWVSSWFSPNPLFADGLNIEVINKSPYEIEDFTPNQANAGILFASDSIKPNGQGTFWFPLKTGDPADRKGLLSFGFKKNIPLLHVAFNLIGGAIPSQIAIIPGSVEVEISQLEALLTDYGVEATNKFVIVDVGSDIKVEVAFFSASGYQLTLVVHETFVEVPSGFYRIHPYRKPSFSLSSNHPIYSSGRIVQTYTGEPNDETQIWNLHKFNCSDVISHQSSHKNCFLIQDMKEGRFLKDLGSLAPRLGEMIPKNNGSQPPLEQFWVIEDRDDVWYQTYYIRPLVRNYYMDIPEGSGVNWDVMLTKKITNLDTSRFYIVPIRHDTGLKSHSYYVFLTKFEQKSIRRADTTVAVGIRDGSIDNYWKIIEEVPGSWTLQNEGNDLYLGTHSLLMNELILSSHKQFFTLNPEEITYGVFLKICTNSLQGACCLTRSEPNKLTCEASSMADNQLFKYLWIHH